MYRKEAREAIRGLNIASGAVCFKLIGEAKTRRISDADIEEQINAVFLYYLPRWNLGLGSQLSAMQNPAFLKAIEPVIRKIVTDNFVYNGLRERAING